jgi:hypothetical protein
VRVATLDGKILDSDYQTNLSYLGGNLGDYYAYHYWLDGSNIEYGNDLVVTITVQDCRVDTVMTTDSKQEWTDWVYQYPY